SRFGRRRGQTVEGRDPEESPGIRAGKGLDVQNPIRKILVPTDFSPCSRHAVEYALALAAVHGASVEIIHVWTLPSNAARFLGPKGETLESFAASEANRQMSEFLSAIPRPKDVSLSSSIHFGFESEVICEVAKGF